MRLVGSTGVLADEELILPLFGGMQQNIFRKVDMLDSGRVVTERRRSFLKNIPIAFVVHERMMKHHNIRILYTN